MKKKFIPGAHPVPRLGKVARRFAQLVAMAGGFAAHGADMSALAEWGFDRAGDAQGWQANAHLTDVVVTNGTLNCRATGSDPILELRPLLELPASPWQVVEIRLRADRDGVAELFWSNTSTGRYGGFSQEKSTRFNVDGDGRWHTYRLLPGWHPEGRIVRLRFDVYDGADFELDRIRVLDLSLAAPVAMARFDFENGAAGWQALGLENDEPPVPWAGGSLLSDPSILLLSPPVRINAAEQNYVGLRMRANPGRHATLFFLTEREPGWHSLTFPIEADGREHTYHLDLLSARDWRGTVVGLGLRPSDEPAMVTVRSLVISDTPQGPPQLEVTSFALAEALPRVGRPAQLVAWLANTGGAKAGPIDATLTLPDGVELLAGQPSEAPASLAPGEEGTLVWTIEARQPVAGEMRLEVEAADIDPATASAPLQITPPFDIAKTTYVPEPQPVRGPCEVGVYYFPGWKTASQWQPLQRFPERRPVLGWYREGDPEVADWHIKWAVEHGITFFAYDWYWSQGVRQLEHALHDGYFKARYRHLLKFCLLWANHNPPGSSSPEDCLAVTRYWIEHYFRRPEHLTFDGQPVMIIFSPHRQTEDLGSDGVKRAFDAMRAECRNAGLKGLHLIACVGDAGGARKAAAEGYDSVTAYNWPHLGMTGEGKFAPFETLVPGYRQQWEHLLAESPAPLWPLPVCGGWDSRPWHGGNNLVRFGRTPALFRRHLLDAREVLGTRNPKSDGPNAILIEAWNEWGEGSYIEPHSEFGFGYLDAIREVFTDAPERHDDVTPADVGLGPYDVPPPEPARTDWDFEHSDEGWASSMQLADLKVTGGTLTARTVGNDPALFGPPMQARASAFDSVLIRLKLARPDGEPFADSAQLFWRTSRLAESEASSIRFPILADGQWHEYDVPVATNPRWRGVITRLRLDPGRQPGVLLSRNYAVAKGGHCLEVMEGCEINAPITPGEPVTKQ